jgi:hypothetical protein
MHWKSNKFALEKIKNRLVLDHPGVWSKPFNLHLGTDQNLYCQIKEEILS